MPPKKWEDEDSEEEEETSSDESVEAPVKPVAPVRRKFDDEDDSDDVADNWEEEEDSEAEREKAKKAAEAKAKADAEAAKNKKSKAQRIEEHREATRLRKLQDDDDDESSDEDEATKRARLRQQEQEADLKNAQDLLGNIDINKSRGAPVKALIVEDKAKPGEAIDLSTIPLFKPGTKAQFDNLSEALVPLLRQSSSKAHYAIWIQNFVKQISQDLPSGEIKKAASTLTALSNEKMKEEKEKEKGGKKSKAAKTKTVLSAGRDIGRGVADTTAYDDGLAEDDFM